MATLQLHSTRIITEVQLPVKFANKDILRKKVDLTHLIKVFVHKALIY